MGRLNHDAEVLYLKEVQALESLRNMLSTKLNSLLSEKTQYQNDEKFLKSDIQVEKQQTDTTVKDILASLFGPVFFASLWGLLAGGTLGLGCGVLSCSGFDSEVFRVFLYLGIGVGVLISLFLTIREVFRMIIEKSKAGKQYATDLRRREHDLVKRKELLGKNVKLQNYVTKQMLTCQQEYGKVNELLNKYYNLNIIPYQYRNIHAVYYIYKFISTSPYGIEQALENYMHQEIANKLDTIIKQMNIMIDQQQEIIVNQRAQEATLNNIQRSNVNMLNRLSSIEKNTEASAQYSRMASIYSEANAYFSLACYSELISK